MPDIRRLLCDPTAIYAYLTTTANTRIGFSLSFSAIIVSYIQVGLQWVQTSFPSIADDLLTVPASLTVFLSFIY